MVSNKYKQEKLTNKEKQNETRTLLLPDLCGGPSVCWNQYGKYG